MKIRHPAVAGRFYPANKIELQKLMEKLVESEHHDINYPLAEKQILGGIVPHAGYVYSGYEAVYFFEILRQSKSIVDTFIIINPNHSGYGSEIAIDNHDQWETPFGRVSLDKDFVQLLPFQKSQDEQLHEHSCEVMVPFLQYFLNHPFEILPIAMSRQNYKNAQIIAKEIYKANRQLNKRIMMIASSDFSHFVSPEEGNKMDNLVLEDIFNFDSEALELTVRKHNISVCGFGPIMSLIEYAKLNSLKPGVDILARGNSGKTHFSKEVVDYISMLFYI